MLKGIRVVELTTEVGGALTGRLMAAYGADVIVVEPASGHAIRSLPPKAGEHPDQSIMFAYLGAGKRSIALDLDDPASWVTVRKLIESADAVLDSYAPGFLASKGLAPEQLVVEMPELVVCSITPFGQTGPRAHWRDTAITAAAAGGQMSSAGDPDREPMKTAGNQGHYQAGLHAFGATLSALFAAQRSKVGDWIDISVQEVQVATLEGAGPNALITGSDAGRSGNKFLAQWGIHECKGGWIGFAAMPRQSNAIYDCIGHPELKDDPAMASGWSPDANALLHVLIPEWTKDYTAAEIFEHAAKFRTPVAMIPNPRELLEWPGLKDNDFWQWVEHPVLGRYPLPGGPIDIVGVGRGTPKRSPLLGEHTAEVLASIASLPSHPAAAAPVPQNPGLPLAGIRVIDMTAVWAGPYATRLLADMGAEVIKVEGPSFADPVRTMTGARAVPEINQSAYFNEYNRSKLGISLDIKKPEGMEALRRMIAVSDVFMENWSSGVAERLGLGYDELRKLKPDIISISMPGFGHTGRDASRVGYGPTIEQMGGLVALQGYEGGGPHRSGISYGDPVSGTVSAGSVVMALLNRNKTGEGCSIVIPQRDVICSLVGEYVAAEALGHPMPTQIGNRDAEFAPQGVYRAKDSAPRPQRVGAMVVGAYTDAWLALSIDSEPAWEGLKRVVADPRLENPDYATMAGRRAHAAALDEILSGWASDKDPDVAAEQLQAAGVAAAPVITPLTATWDAHLEARGAFMPYYHREPGQVRSTRPTWRMMRRPPEALRAAPCFGEHTDEVLARIGGYSAAEIEEFAKKSVTTTDLIAGAAG